MSADANC